MQNLKPECSFNMGKTNHLDIIETMGVFNSWEDRYRCMVDLGKEIPKMEEQLSPIRSNGLKAIVEKIRLIATSVG